MHYSPVVTEVSPNSAPSCSRITSSDIKRENLQCFVKNKIRLQVQKCSFYSCIMSQWCMSAKWKAQDKLSYCSPLWNTASVFAKAAWDKHTSGSKAKKITPNKHLWQWLSHDYCVAIWILVLSWCFVSRPFLKLTEPYWLLTYAVETGVMQRKIQQGILYSSYQAVCIAMVSHVLIIPLGVSSFDVPLFFHYYLLYLSVISLLAFR